MIIKGVVAMRDKQPYVQIKSNGKIVAQMTVAEARNVAIDILQQATRAEADSMIRKFFDKMEYPTGAADAVMIEFRKFRSELDKQEVVRFESNPDGN